MTALIRAAGSGARLGQGPKAWVQVAGVPLVELALRPLAGRVGRVVIALPPTDVARGQDQLAAPGARIIAGGGSRWETTRLLAGTATTRWVLLHDTVHPMVSPRIVDDLLAAAETSGAAVPALPIEDFVWDASEGSIRKPRQTLIIQTPVVLLRETLLAAVELIRLRPDVVDAEASIIEVLAVLAVPWTFVDGDPRNIKITHPGDLEVAEALIAVGALASDRAESGT